MCSFTQKEKNVESDWTAFQEPVVCHLDLNFGF